MRYFKFIKDFEFRKRLYKKDEEFVINNDNEVLDEKGKWIFDCDSRIANTNGIVVKNKFK